MATEKKFGSVKRFGTRYGRKVKEKLAKIEKVQRSAQKCPYCAYNKVKRVAAGIWYCKKCKAKFTGKAYSVKRKMAIEKEAEKEPKEEAK
jgi:large subunit ribosomal protein L37Ae